MSMKFKIGDRVRAIREVDGVNLKGKTGTVVDVLHFVYDVGVKFDEEFLEGHTLGGKSKKGFGRWGKDKDFELLQERKIVITSDGKETLARLYEGNKVIKSATAKCSPDDTFDFEKGAKLAFERLTAEYKVGERYSVTGLRSKDGVIKITGVSGDYVKFEIVEGMADWGKTREFKKGSCFAQHLKPYIEKWRVVNRAPKRGDYIRLVNGSFSFNKKGDILKVFDGNKYGVKVLGSDHPRKTDVDEHLWHYLPCEYEVVEPIEPIDAIKDEPKYYNGKVVCVKKREGFAYTVGKVYEFIDGKVKIDNGNKLPAISRIKTLEEWNDDKSLYCDFIPFVE